MAHDVFISYASGDKPIADMVCAALEQQGIRCWIAPRDVQPGVDWSGAIVGAIRGSRVMVLVFSDHANASKHIPREIERAINHEIPIVPLRIENVQPRGSLEYSLSSVHWLDALTAPMDEHIRRLGLNITAILGGVATPASGRPPPKTDSIPAPSEPARPRPAAAAEGQSAALPPRRTSAAYGRLLPATLGALLLVAAVAVAIIVLRPAAHPSDLGFEPRRLMSMELSLSEVVEVDLEDFCDELEKGGAISSAAAIDIAPFGRGSATATANGADVQLRRISSGYFNTVATTITRGRDLSRNERTDQRVSLVSELAAQKLFADGDPLGQTVTLATAKGTFPTTIVGVVADIRQDASANGVLPMVYLPMRSQPGRRSTVVVRSTGNETAALERMRDQASAFGASNPGVFSDYTRMEDTLAKALPRSSSGAAVAAAAVLAILLAGTALYYARRRTG